MKQYFIYISLLLFCTHLWSQGITGIELLDKAITYHDPNGNWNTFNGKLFITMETPNNANRDSEIHINLPAEYFYAKAKRDTTITEYTVTKNDCVIGLNGRTNLSEETTKKYRLSCERATMYKNYYTYLYGLPMKLKDKGTIIDEKVVLKKFQGKEYLVLKATYSEEVGKDIWQFYFNPKTYAMEVYQFFHTKKGENKIDSDSGEYILLSEELIINGIKMPKKRAWYTNKEDQLLGVDILGKTKD